jgi:hypothetical protein
VLPHDIKKGQETQRPYHYHNDLPNKTGNNDDNCTNELASVRQAMYWKAAEHCHLHVSGREAAPQPKHPALTHINLEQPIDSSAISTTSGRAFAQGFAAYCAQKAPLSWRGG